MKTIKEHLLESLAIESNKLVKAISKKVGIKNYVESSTDNVDKLEDIEEAISKAVKMCNLQAPAYFTTKSELEFATNEGLPKSIAKGLSDSQFSKLKKDISVNSKDLFVSEEEYGLVITGNNKGFMFDFYDVIRIIVVDKASNLI